MSNVILPIALWAAIGLAGLSVLVMGLSGLRSVWYGKVQPLTIAIIAIPGVVVVVLGLTMETWVQAGIYTLVTMFALLLLGMVATGLRQAFQSAFS
ncbi:hypothetical protein BSZ35_05915 [Salinibacter sp. 10B]|uniref:hypothetical protein n=1 Tax=Salinibacter sp. 10B TaxID=1923971 RepID=UPI000CF423EC|nr:hypothetical protein [Salinibacter sp. 10B]PQJ34198.1 hypothetical protein BSZ35_05915 [Salinibacter sp. 10B]